MQAYSLPLCLLPLHRLPAAQKPTNRNSAIDKASVVLRAHIGGPEAAVGLAQQFYIYR